jgi:leucyl-tRNA synthetase
MLRITDYADRLLDDLDGLEWPAKVKKMQADWIGKSYGAEVDFQAAGRTDKIKVFTTRPDTLYGATFMVLSPEHELAEKLATPDNTAIVQAYIKKAASRSSIDRMADKEKTGVFTGSYAVNPLTGQADMPVWISDYVLADYGTGAIMCVPAHDERDFAFAKKFNLPIVRVIAPVEKDQQELTEAYTGDGVLVNSGKFNGLTVPEAIKQVTAYLAEKGLGKQTVNYKLRDWVFSRQRYWGEPIPIIHCDVCGAVPVPESELPVLLPDVKTYQPTDTGESPLASVTEWVNTTCPVCGGQGRRETNTMPTWAGSSWYFLRYADPKNRSALADKKAIKKWLPVDFYIGGVEHAVLHCLYARFYTKFLYDIGVTDFTEPFTRLFNIGMINRFGHKMDKSGDNGVSPDSMVDKYGCDALRMYEMFVGPPEMDSEWDDKGIEGVFRYLNKVWKLAGHTRGDMTSTREMERLRHKLIYDITTRLDALSLNTVISGFMENTNALADEAARAGGVDNETMETLIILLAPFAPHMAEELWEAAGHNHSVFTQTWPAYDTEKLKTETITIALQINGKFRESIDLDANADKDTALAAAEERLAKRLAGAKIVKRIYVPGKIANFVVQ